MQLINSLKQKIITYYSTPKYINNRVKYGVWNVLRSNFNYSIWVKTKTGSKILLGKDRVDEYILEDLFSDKKIYDPIELVLNKDDIILDVGAHHGIYAVEMSKKYGVEVLCIEPDPNSIEFIERHSKKNNINIIIIPFAVGEKSDFVYLADNLDGSWGKTVEKESNEKNSIQVYQKTLSELLIGIDKNKIKLIKSNCEGGEFALVDQLILLKMKPDYIILMIHPDRGDKSKLVKSLLDYNYTLLPVYESEVNPCYHFRLNEK